MERERTDDGYTVHELAALSGCTVRTLHHYDELGLVRARRARNGYRRYGTAEVDRLQQVLLYREADMPLADIKRLLDDPAFDARDALAGHLRELHLRKQRLDGLIASVEKTLACMEGSGEMNDQEKFEAFKQGLVDKNEQQYGEEVRERWQNKIRYLLVDEYQDTNTSQYELVKLLVGSRARFTVVGDDDQSIYSWRGARPQNLVLLSQDFPALKVIKLEQNYRSSGRILKAANILIANNPHVFEKRLFSELGYGTELKVLSANNEEHEAERVTGELIAHHFVNKTQYKDYAILYRGNHQSRVFEKFLMQNRIPYKISGGTSFFSRPEIKDLLAYLRVLTNPDDDSAFLRIVNTPKREIGPATLKKLGEWAMTRNKSMFTASFDMGLSQTLSGRGYEALTRFTHWLAEIQRLAEREPIAAVRDLIHGMDYESWLYETSPSPKAAEMRMKNVNQLFSWMTEMLEGSELDEPMTLTQVVTRFTLRDMMERGESEEELDQVQLMTLHASKGLEFPYVYMVGMEEGFLPHQSSIDEDNIDEERRLAYVGITRAQKELTFTLCKERRQYGELVRPEPSRFLLELPQDDLIWEQERKVVSAEERMQKGQSHLANLKAMMAAKRGK